MKIQNKERKEKKKKKNEMKKKERNKIRQESFFVHEKMNHQ